jgi:hypothetical protein
MKRNGRNPRLVLRVLVAVAGMVGAFSQIASARPQQLDQQITIQGGQVAAAAGPVGPVEVGFQSFRAIVPGKVVKGAPYSAVASTEMNQLLSDGNQISHDMKSNVYRDSQGRTRREENFVGIGPLLVTTTNRVDKLSKAAAKRDGLDNDSSQPHSVVFISDPVSGADYVLEPENKIARKMPSLPADGITTNRVFGVGEAVHVAGDSGVEGVQVSGGPGGPISTESRFQTSSESLGQQTIEGVVADGKRITTNIPAGAMGNQRPISTVTEEWFSSELQAIVLSTTKDPRMGETTYRLTNIQRTEPPATLFTVPADYTIKDFDKVPPFPRPPQSNE